jgi:hypothetical protein
VNEACTCDFGPLSDWMCIEGTVYGPCGHESCGGLCEPTEACGCACHSKTLEAQS